MEQSEKLRVFNVTVRSDGLISTYAALAVTAYCAFMDAADAQGDEPCAITVTPLECLA